MKSIFLVTPKNLFVIFGYVKALFLFLLMSACFASSLHAGEVGQPSPVDNINFPDSQGIRNGVMTSGGACPTKEEIIQKTRTLQMPFVANNGQVDERVGFYAKTFGGTVFVTKEGEIVYSLPSGRDVPAGASQESGRGREAGGQRSRGAGEQGRDVVSGWHGQAPLVRAESEFIVAYAYLPLLHADNANCSPDRIFAKSLIAAYIPGLQEGTDKQSLSMPPNPHSEIQNPQSPIRGVALKETLIGAKIGGITGEQPAVTTVNYFTGNDKSKWKANVPTYNRVNLGEIYKGIELSLKAYGDNVEKLFCVKPGASPELIKVQLDGSKSLRVNQHGQLEADTELGLVKFTRPIAYQEIEGQRVEVSVEYSIQGSGGEATESRGAGGPGGRGELETPNSKPETKNSKLTYGFVVASYDKTKDLIIDPLLASTYLGGGDEDSGQSLALDTSGNVYVTGSVYFSNSAFPTTIGAYDTSHNGIYDGFVSKLDSGLTSLLASTFLGGSGKDAASSLALDKSGNVYVTGYTVSSDFPTTSGAYDTAYNGGINAGDVFVSKLNSGLTNLLASTFLGGYADDFGNYLAIDVGGNVYLTGYTTSADFPTTSGAYGTSTSGGVFVSKLDSGLTSLLGSTFLGRGGENRGNSLALDTSDVYVTGYTTSADFPVTIGAYGTSTFGGTDVFVSKLNSGLTRLLASTYLGGYTKDVGNSLTLDTSGNVYVTGDTWSTNFPTTIGAYDTSRNGGYNDVFVSKLNSGLTHLLASTYLGGSGNEMGFALTLDTGGNVYVTGTTYSTDFPTTRWAYDASHNGPTSGRDVFVSKLDSGLTSLLVSTYLGGTGFHEQGNSLALDTSGNVYLTGYTSSSDFPTTSRAYDTSFNGFQDVFVSSFDKNFNAGKDTDGDGLLDDWELNGYDDDEDGVIDVNLPAMGANYKHKDIFVEIDWMSNNDHNHKPSASVLKAVQQAFKNAPVTNPDKVNGVNLHLDVGALGGGNVVAHDDDLNPVWDEFDAIKNVHFDKKRAHIFHYCLFAHNHDGGASAGISRDIPASDFIISLGSWDNQVGTKKQQAADFMHELGHNLGLRHGGNDNVNYKPNFLSIMNYFFSMYWLRYDGKDNKLDYSQLDIDDLDENSLSEKDGLNQVGGDKTVKKYGTSNYYAQDRIQVVNKSYRNVDWNHTGGMDYDGIYLDMNGDGALTKLKGHCEEWKKIVYEGGAVGVGVGLKAVIQNPPPTCPEFTYEKYLQMKESTVETK